MEDSQVAQAERALQAGIERRASGGLGGWLVSVVIEKPTAPQPCHDPHLDVDRERFEIHVIRCWQSPKVGASRALGRGEHAVGHRDVKMNAQRERPHSFKYSGG